MARDDGAKGGQRYENKTKVIFHCGISTEAKNFKPRIRVIPSIVQKENNRDLEELEDLLSFLEKNANLVLKYLDQFYSCFKYIPQTHTLYILIFSLYF